jgi:hypothetical protein
MCRAITMERLRARVIRQHRIDAQSAAMWHMVGLESTTGDRSRLDAVESHRMTPMATCSSNLSESRLIPRDGFSCASACVAPGQASTDSLKSIGGIVTNPTVKITPTETAKRPGTGWHWWFSEPSAFRSAVRSNFASSAPRIFPHCTMRVFARAARRRSTVSLHHCLGDGYFPPANIL